MVFSGRQQKKYFMSNNQKAHYGIHLFANWMRQNHEKVLEEFLKNKDPKEKQKLTLCL